MSFYFNREPKIGDYVLATKYQDGDPADHFCLGWVKGVYSNSRFDVVDDKGKSYRSNGFRRARVVSEDLGAWLLPRFPQMESCGLSVWRWMRLGAKELRGR